ncbi:MAG: hypothetical protein WCD35_19135 [Mycobacteriales bacterium]
MGHGRLRRGLYRRIATATLLTAVAAAPAVALPHAADAGPPVGSLVAQVHFSQDCGSGLGVGVAFDGSNLWYSCYASSPDLFRADPRTGQVTGSWNIANGLGAVAYDAGRNILWAGWGSSSGTGDVRQIALDSSHDVVGSTVAFSTCGDNNCYLNLDDGLAYEAQNDTLYIKPDVGKVIHRYSASNGQPLSQFSWAGNSCYNSGLAIGDSLLFEGSDGCGHVWVVDKNNPSAPLYDWTTNVPGDPNFRDEGLACDPFTFAPTQVLWSKEAYSPNRVAAFAIPDGTCGVGGRSVANSTPSSSQHPVVFVHGLTQKAGSAGFDALRNAISQDHPGDITDFTYYQDVSCDADALTPPAIPTYSYGFPLHTDSISTDPKYCDSEPAIGLNALKLDALVRKVHDQTGQSVVLIGYSMGGATIRGMLSYSQTSGDGVAGMVDSVFTIHAVHQGSWIAKAGSFARNHQTLASLANKIGAPDPTRPAVEDLAPRSDYVNWVNTRSGALPAIPYVNAFGDMTVVQENCFLFWCSEHDIEQVGDVVILPGTDSPTDTPSDGGARFLPANGLSNQYDESDKLFWDPQSDSLMVGVGIQAIQNPRSHLKITDHMDEVQVPDCRTHDKVTLTKALAEQINARISGTTYACTP